MWSVVPSFSIFQFLSCWSRAGVRAVFLWGFWSDVSFGACRRPAGTSFHWSAEKVSFAAFSVTSGIYVSSVLGERLQPREETSFPPPKEKRFSSRNANNNLASGYGAVTLGKDFNKPNNSGVGEAMMRTRAEAAIDSGFRPSLRRALSSWVVAVKSPEV